ncbi:hypothetical protein ACFL2C_04155 [Patescibacteria group bacterium]
MAEKRHKGQSVARLMALGDFAEEHGDDIRVGKGFRSECISLATAPVYGLLETQGLVDNLAFEDNQRLLHKAQVGTQLDVRKL